MQRPSITFMNRVYPPGRGATGRVLRDLAKSFAREGWRVTIISTGDKAVKERDGAIRVMRVKGSGKPKNILAYLWVLLKMTWCAWRIPADHVLVTMSDPPLLAIAGSWLQKRKGYRHIHWCQDLYPDILPALGINMPDMFMNMAKRAMLRALAACDRIVVIGRCVGKTLTTDGLNPRNITFIPNWPDFELVQSLPSGQASPKTPPYIHAMSHAKPYEDQLKAGPRFRVLYAGTLGLAHPMETVLEAAKILNETDPVVEFVFVGEGPRYDALAAERSRLQLDNIRLLPYQPVNRLRETMEGGDLHLVSMAEEAEGYLVPSKIYSALAVHRPSLFIGPSVCEAAKVISDFKAGHVLQQGDVNGLIEAIRGYINAAELWYAAHEGAKRAAEIYRPKESIEAWIERAWDVVKDDIARGKAG